MIMENDSQEKPTGEIERVVNILLNDPHKRGPRFKIESLDQLMPLLKSYFTPFPKTPTLNGLAIFLGYADKKSLFDMAERDNELSMPIKRAIGIIEAAHEGNLFNPQCTGSIFWLKNRGWSDKLDITTDGQALTPQTVSYLEITAPDALQSSPSKALLAEDVTITDTQQEQQQPDADTEQAI
jgi:hypothetical protein